MQVPPKYYEPRYLWKRREDGRVSVFIIRILRNSPNTYETNSGSVGQLSDEARIRAMYPMGDNNSSFILNTYTHSKKNQGRANEKDEVQVCIEAYERTIRDKKRGGFREAASLEEACQEHKKMPHVTAEELPVLTDLPRELPGFRPWKPKNRLEPDSALWKRASHGSAYFMRKMDGYGAILVKENDQIALFSLRNSENLPSGGTLLDRVPLLKWWHGDVGDLIPNRSMLFGELIPIEEDMQQDGCYEYVTSIIKSGVDEALLKQDRNGFLGFYLWDIAMWAGIPTAHTFPYSARLGTIMDICQSIECGEMTDGMYGLLSTTDPTYLKKVSHLNMDDCMPAFIEPTRLVIPAEEGDPIAYATSVAGLEGWEGFVVIDPDEPFGHHAWSLTGRPKRPSSAAKLKTRLEDDFIAIWNPEEDMGEYGTGKNKNRIGAVELYQMVGEEGDAIHCGRCGSGFTDLQRERFMKMFRDGPVVVEVEFHRWSSKGKLVNPSFSRIRTDKSKEECLYSGPVDQLTVSQ